MTVRPWNELLALAKKSRPGPRSHFVGIRLRPNDAKALGGIAEEMGVGPSTFARIIVEGFIQAHQSEQEQEQ